MSGSPKRGTPEYEGWIKTPAYTAMRERCREASSGERNPMYGVRLYGELNHAFGKHLLEETKRKISDAHKGILKGVRVGEKHPFFGKHHSAEALQKMSESHGGKRPHEYTEECRKNMSRNRTGKCVGPDNHFWKGGISFEPYCPKFTKEFKERVRAFFGHRCVECGTPQNGKKLSIHHVNFNKKTCCDNSIPLFVPLCVSCHAKTSNTKIRGYWQQHFTELINGQYGGSCYLMRQGTTP
jgi:hypothetical protein